MKAQPFEQTRREDWERLEGLTRALEARRRLGRDTLSELLRLYRRAAFDLAEAQTHFPDSPMRQRLELLVARAYGAIYREPDEKLGASGFFLERLPRTFRANAGYFVFALVVFSIACLAGVAIVSLEEGWAGLCLPPSAIEGVQRGELWTDLFGLMPSTVISTVVFYNNAVVCFSAFALGLTFGLGTLYVLMVNGLMLGSAMTLCWRHGMLGQLGGFVAAHGLLEISAILLAAAGGLMLADALIRPGPYRRRDALRLRAREALTLAVGALPFLAAAGLIEGAVSPGTLSAPAKYTLGITSGLLMYLYLITAGRVATAAPSTWRPGRSAQPPARAHRQAPAGNTPGSA